MKVNSSAISKVKWNPLWATVVFNHGKKYRYYNVGLGTFIKVIRAESVGKAYNEFIKGKFVSEVA